MTSQLAAQMYTVREYTKTELDLAHTLEQIRKIGYPAVQMSAVGAMNGESPTVTAVQARKMLDDNGLRCIATHRSFERLRDNTDEEILFHVQLNCTFAAIGGLPGNYAGAEGYRRFMADATPVIAALKKSGIRFGVHNHDHEFMRIAGSTSTLYDLLIDDGGPDLMLELDVYWAIHAGVDPVVLFPRLKGRVPVIHIKDKEVVKEGPVMAPVGEGNHNWPAIVPACQAAGVEWYAVEQDEYRRDPFDCLRSSFDYLTSMGL